MHNCSSDLMMKLAASSVVPFDATRASPASRQAIAEATRADVIVFVGRSGGDKRHKHLLPAEPLLHCTPAPRMAVYVAAKAFVIRLTESAWVELRGSGVTVFALSPGAPTTEYNADVGTDDATAGGKMRPRPATSLARERA